MVWSILAAIPLLFLIGLYLVRFRYHIEVETPAVLRATAGVHFLWWKKIIAIEPGRAVWSRGAEPESDEDDEMDYGDIEEPAQDRSGERGAMRIPDFITARMVRARNRARKAGTRWVLDPGVWRLLIAYLWRSGRRAVWLVNPRLESLHLALRDAYSLGRIAGFWSVLSGTIPALACDVTYGFGAKQPSVKARGGGRFTALGVLTLLLLSLTTFPWAGLASRFAACWRDPRLSRWQKARFTTLKRQFRPLRPKGCVP